MPSCHTCCLRTPHLSSPSLLSAGAFCTTRACTLLHTAHAPAHTRTSASPRLRGACAPRHLPHRAFFLAPTLPLINACLRTSHHQYFKRRTDGLLLGVSYRRPLPNALPFISTLLRRYELLAWIRVPATHAFSRAAAPHRAQHSSPTRRATRAHRRTHHRRCGHVCDAASMISRNNAYISGRTTSRVSRNLACLYSSTRGRPDQPCTPTLSLPCHCLPTCCTAAGKATRLLSGRRADQPAPHPLPGRSYWRLPTAGTAVKRHWPCPASPAPAPSFCLSSHLPPSCPPFP